ncbi:T-cell surface glycoprotein CD3 zeta chain isoform X2 [Lissotriton helveticus]
MELQRVALAAFLQATFASADAQVLGLTDPKLCYMLDGILFLYAIIITALFIREKFTKTKDAPGAPETDDIYNKLAVGQREEYDVLNKNAGDAEKGGRKQQRRKNPQDAVYSALQKDKMGAAYSEIGIKGEKQRRRGKGNDGIYQGLSAATKDTYDALQMQPLPPR